MITASRSSPSTELAKLSPLERRSKVIETAAAWGKFPSTQPLFDSTVDVPAPAAYEAVFVAQHADLKAAVNRHIDATYLFPLKDAPDDDALRTRLLKVYLSLDQADAAITMASTYLLDERGDRASTYNHLGNAYVIKGDMTQAALNYRRASDLRPQDATHLPAARSVLFLFQRLHRP